MNVQARSTAGKGAGAWIFDLPVTDITHLGPAGLGPKPGLCSDGWPQTFLLTLADPGFTSKPGQFVMVRPTGWELDPVWARPISIAGHDEQGLKLLVQVAGRGTGDIARLRKGDVLTLWGPLGNSFTVADEGPTLCIAGGIGVAPFLYYTAHHLRPESVSLILGHRAPAGRYPLGSLPELASLELYREESVDDLRTFIGVLESRIREVAEAGGLVLACGPTPLLRTVRHAALECGAKAQLSLENIMACGVGACLGCVVPDMDGNAVAVCTRGPNFWADAVDLDARIGGNNG